MTTTFHDISFKGYLPGLNRPRTKNPYMLGSSRGPYPNRRKATCTVVILERLTQNRFWRESDQWPASL
jgi:hypothetical protein